MAMSEDSETIVKFISKGIHEAIQQEAVKIYEQKKKEFLEQFDRDKDHLIAGIVVNMVKKVEFETIGNKILLSINTETKNDGR